MHDTGGFFVQLRTGFIAGWIVMLSEPFIFSDVTAVTWEDSDRGPTVGEIKHPRVYFISLSLRCTCVFLIISHSAKLLQRKVSTFSQAFSCKWTATHQQREQVGAQATCMHL